MPSFQIEFINFCVFVHHRNGLAVLPGSEGHQLVFQDAIGSETAVNADVFLIASHAGEPVQGGETAMPDPAGYMPELAWMCGHDVVIQPDRVFGSARQFQNARIHLHGGRLVDRPAAPEIPDPMQNLMPEALWDFQALGAAAPGRHRITNRAVFVGDIEAGTDYTIRVGGNDVALTADVTVRFVNRDLRDCVQPTGIDEELPLLLKAIDVVPTGLSTIVDLAQMKRWILNGETCKPCSSICTQQNF